MNRHLLALSAVVGVIWSSASAQDLAPNGSFEEGTEGPQGWHKLGEGRWLKDSRDARHGGRYVSAAKTTPGTEWESDAVAIEPTTGYRIEAWVRCRSGRAWIGWQFGDRPPKSTSLENPPSVTKGPDWQYFAVEVNSGKANQARISLGVDGEADFDKVSLARIAVSTLGNRGVEKDKRGRLGLWNEEKADVLAGVPRGGAQRFDDQIKLEGQNSVVLEPSSPKHWYAISSVNYPLPAWTGRLRLMGHARCANGATAQLAVCWVDDKQQLLETYLGPESTGADWQELNLTPPEPPAGAASVRLVALAKGGSVWFDDFDLRAFKPDKPLVKVLVNQVGYDNKGPKSAVVATNFFPTESPQIAWELQGQDDKIAARGQVGCSGRIHATSPDDWGWYFWRVDFSTFQAPGVYKAVAIVPLPTGVLARGESPPISIRPNALLHETAPLGVDFFFVQRCGCEVPGWHGPCHLDDARLPDGSHIDVTGGWHSAGDYNKPMWQFGDSAAVYALAVAFDEHRDLLSQNDRDGDGLPDALDEARWGAAFLAKMQNPDDGSLRGDVNQGPRREWMRWTAPDVHTDNKPGTDDDPVIAQPVGNTPLAIAGWARLATLLNARSTPNDYLDRARKLWSYYSKPDAAAANPLLLFGAVEMYTATKEDAFKTFADRSVDTLLKAQRPDGGYPGDSGDHGDWTAAALATYALRFSGGERDARLRESLTKYLEFCLSRADNPFGLSRQGVDANKPVYFHPTVGLGVNFWLLGRAWAAALIYRLTGDERARTYAVDQIDWVFGKNPYGLCMFEGKGVLNPPRFHHRYNMIPGKERGAVPGAIPNGFVSDMGIADRPGFDMSRGGNRSPSYRTSEPWLVHNVLHLLAVSALSSSESR
ncbi:MAG: glycoside hydrolase family 9 protein [Planctomycetaceae bacterium]